MADHDLISIKSYILNSFCKLDKNSIDSIEQWISSGAYRTDLVSKKMLMKSDKVLLKYGNEIKKLVPLEGVLPSENVVFPLVGDQSDCKKDNTCQIDEFLYDEEQVQELVEKGKLSRHYCADCCSKNIEELKYVTHSIPRHQLQYIYKVLLPSCLDGKQVLDIGSRLGGVLYSAYHLSNAAKIVGIEINKECCQIQDKMVDLFSMDRNRIKIINSDILNSKDIIEMSDVIIINVFDFFVDIEKHKEMWLFFKKHFKNGAYLVTTRSVADTLESLDLIEELVDWLTICKPLQLENEIFFDIEDCGDLYFYTINNK